MSMMNTMEYLKEERAKFARDVEYLKETSSDDVIDDRMEKAELLFESESLEDLMEAADFVERLSSEENVVESVDEINRIINAESDITFEEMIGL